MITDQLASLESTGIRFVRFTWCDNANVIRAKAVHVSQLLHYLDYGVGITAGEQGLPVMYDAVIPESGLTPVGEIRLMADWSTLTPLPFSPGHARVLGDMVLDGVPWELCPRHFLMRMSAEAAREGIDVQGAFENEFFLLKQTPEGIVPADDTVFAASWGMDQNCRVINDIADALLEQKIPVEMYYPESGPGQHEMPVRYTHVLQAADRQIGFRETVHAVALCHGLRASFLPKIFADKAGNGCHFHFSLWREGKNLMPYETKPWGLSATALGFMAGILHHLPALMALTTPSPNSYRRIRPHFWSGAFRCWGVDNREAAVRVPSNPAGTGPRHVELKTVDASANPYMAAAAIIAAGLDGLRRGLSPGEPVNLDPGNLSEIELRDRGVDALPQTLAKALEHLRQDDVLLGALGPALAKAFLAVRQAEWEALKDSPLEEEVKLLLERY